ncbi:MAG: serine/threonine-protein kinase [Planctomycetota bacterium]
MPRRKNPVDESGRPLEQPFAGYEVFQKLAERDRSASWAAWDLRMDREVFLKELRPPRERIEAIVEDFFEEAQSVARVKHPHLVRALDAGRAARGREAGEAQGDDPGAGNASQDVLYMAMEWVRGESLARRLDARERPLREIESLRIALALARALDHLHGLGMVHRAVKPSNVLLGADGIVRLGDLGVPLDLLYDSPWERARLDPAYAAPETLQADCCPDSRADLYSLGVVLFHMVTGALPFGGEDAELVRKHIEEEPPTARSARPGLSAATSGLIASLLAKEPAGRPDDPAALLERLAGHPLLAEQAPEETPADEAEDDDTLL